MDSFQKFVFWLKGLAVSVLLLCSTLPGVNPPAKTDAGDTPLGGQICRAHTPAPPRSGQP